MNQFRFSTLPIRQHRLSSFVWILLIVIMPIGASRAPGAGHAVLEVPLSVQVRTPGDGSIKKFPGGKISRRTNRFEMPAGDQIVEMRYHGIWPDSVAGPADDPAVELPGSDVSPFELMQFWWKQANATERKRFFEWTVEQE